MSALCCPSQKQLYQNLSGRINSAVSALLSGRVNAITAVCLPLIMLMPAPDSRIICSFTDWKKANDIDLSVTGSAKAGSQIEFSRRSMYGKQSDAVAYSGDQANGSNRGTGSCLKHSGMMPGAGCVSPGAFTGSLKNTKRNAHSLRFRTQKIRFGQKWPKRIFYILFTAAQAPRAPRSGCPWRPARPLRPCDPPLGRSCKRGPRSCRP